MNTTWREIVLPPPGSSSFLYIPQKEQSEESNMVPPSNLSVPTMRFVLSLLFPFLLNSSANAQEITGFYLVDPVNDVDIRPLVDGDTIDLAVDEPPLTVRAEAAGDVSRVSFDLDDGFIQRTEGTPPYALGGDRDADYDAVATLEVLGSHTVTATAFGPDDQEGGSMTITFQVIDSDLPPPPPTPAPDPSHDVTGFDVDQNGDVFGELKKWHKVTIGFSGVPQGERNNLESPFTYYRLDVNFTHPASSKSYLVPGYYACDGNAANTGAINGPIWLVHFSPDEVGTWTWQASFTKGENVAQNGGGVSASFFDGETGSFEIEPTDKTGRDLRGKGRLQYVGAHHLRFAETGEWFLKAGADSPENFLAYADFDNTPDRGHLKTWAPHVQDYREGDPTWAGGKGKGIIGAVNYLSEKGMNAFSFLPRNVQGDDKSVFMYLSDDPQDFQTIDCSKTAQWEVVFEHADKMGMFLHFKTQETENDQLLDGGELGLERKLYYRELIARFGHHLALNWNLGEENTNTDEQRKAFSDYIKAIDPYDHPIVIHTFPGAKDDVYTPLLGYSSLDGASLQSNPSNVFDDTLTWVQQSAAAGRPWIVANDEQGSAGVGVLPDADDANHTSIRRDVLWGNIMAGGAGLEYYFGYSYPNSDLTCEDYRSRSNMWDQSRHALEFFSNFEVPFWDMSNANELMSSDSSRCLAESNGRTLVVYLREGGTDYIDLTRYFARGSYNVRWYDPRIGGTLPTGSVSTLAAGSIQSLGFAPYDDDQDWLVLLQYDEFEGGAPPTTAPQTAAPTPAPTRKPTTAPQTAVPTIAQTTAVEGGPTPTNEPLVETETPVTTPTISAPPTTAPQTAAPTSEPFVQTETTPQPTSGSLALPGIVSLSLSVACSLVVIL
jgi:hypothetical protein